ncbi:MAG: hypothetical protein V1914_01950 [archaeon]
MEKLRLYGSGNEGRRNYYILGKEQKFLSLFPMFLLNCGIQEIGIFEDYQEDAPKIKDMNNTLEHFENQDYDIDVVYTSDKVILIVRTASENREKLVAAIEKIATA